MNNSNDPLLLNRPDRKKYSLLRDKYFREDSRIRYLWSKSINMNNEWENIKELIIIRTQFLISVDTVAS